MERQPSSSRFFAFSVNDLGICEYDFCFGIFSPGYGRPRPGASSSRFAGRPVRRLGAAYMEANISSESCSSFGVEFLYWAWWVFSRMESPYLDNGIDLARRGNGFPARRLG